MGYLIVLSGTFAAGLMLTAMLLGWLSVYFLGEVHEWVLIASLFVAFIGAVAAADRYEMGRCGRHVVSR